MEFNNTTLFSSADPETNFARWHFLAFLLSAFAMATILGNALVIVSVVCRPNLHTPTGYLVLSLAMADLIVGLGVMPLNIVLEMYDQVWLFSLAACDFWHSLDVLASTASIWNLCVIAVDRCIAVSDPLNYPQLMNTRRVTACIAVVWIGSAMIAFPAVAWWRTASPELYVRSDRCLFTDDTGYLIFSSLLSFYLPLLIIVAAYGRVYLIASKRQRSLVEGRQPLPCNPSIYIRVHRGGANAVGTVVHSINSPMAIDNRQSNHPLGAKSDGQALVSNVVWTHHDAFGETPVDADARTALRESQKRSYGSYQSVQTHKISSNHSSVITSSARTSRSDSGYSHHSRRSRISAVSMGSSMDSCRGESKRRRKPRTSLILRLLAKESKAAKTLGIVVGVFIACWLPFFVVNILSGACGKRCHLLSDDGYRLAFTVVTWLGHCNSALNPLIYTCFNREFRTAFAYVLFCEGWTGRGRAHARQRQLNRHFTSVNGQSFCAKKGIAKAIEGGLNVIVPQGASEHAIVVSSKSEDTGIQDNQCRKVCL